MDLRSCWLFAHEQLQNEIFSFLFDPLCYCVIIPVYMKCSDSCSTSDTERCIKMQNWFTNDWHKYFPEGIYHSHSPSLHITMQMSRPSCFSIYWNTLSHSTFIIEVDFSELYIFFVGKCLHTQQHTKRPPQHWLWQGYF